MVYALAVIEPWDATGEPRALTPWAFALNRTATTDDATVTLLAFNVVGGLVRVSGLVCFRRPDTRLARMPTLVVSPHNQPWLSPIGAHLLPQGDLAWVAWIFERPEVVLGAYSAQIDHLDLAYRTAGHGELVSPGPWVFHFRLQGRPGSSQRRREERGRSSEVDA
jgi:hypothetical protein